MHEVLKKTFRDALKIAGPLGLFAGIISDVITPLLSLSEILFYIFGSISIVLGIVFYRKFLAILKQAQNDEFISVFKFKKYYNDTPLSLWLSISCIFSIIFLSTWILGLKSNPKKGFIVGNVTELSELQNNLINNLSQTKQTNEIAKSIKNDLLSVKKDTSSIKLDTNVIREDTANIKKDTTIIKFDTANIKQDTNIIKEDTAIIKEDTTTIKGSLSGLTDRVAEMNTGIMPNLRPKNKMDYRTNIFLAMPKNAQAVEDHYLAYLNFTKEDLDSYYRDTIMRSYSGINNISFPEVIETFKKIYIKANLPYTPSGFEKKRDLVSSWSISKKIDECNMYVLYTGCPDKQLIKESGICHEFEYVYGCNWEETKKRLQESKTPICINIEKSCEGENIDMDLCDRVKTNHFCQASFK